MSIEITEVERQRAVRVWCACVIREHQNSLSWPELLLLTQGATWPGMPDAFRDSKWRIRTDFLPCQVEMAITTLMDDGAVVASPIGRLRCTRG